MNPFLILNINPTDDKMAIRRAYVREIKLNHPDLGGNKKHIDLIKEAYESLINNVFQLNDIETDVRLPLINFLEGCIATVIIKTGEFKGTTIEFKVPSYTYPGTIISFSDKNLTLRKIYVKLLENSTNDYTRLDSSIVIRKQINKIEAQFGTIVNTTNFDNVPHVIEIPPNTNADRLVYNINGAGFYNRNSRIRGNLAIIIEVQKEGN
jgi:DnaJ-class molecular chaperone